MRRIGFDRALSFIVRSSLWHLRGASGVCKQGCRRPGPLMLKFSKLDPESMCAYNLDGVLKREGRLFGTSIISTSPLRMPLGLCMRGWGLSGCLCMTVKQPFDSSFEKKRWLCVGLFESTGYGTASRR